RPVPVHERGERCLVAVAGEPAEQFRVRAGGCGFALGGEAEKGTDGVAHGRLRSGSAYTSPTAAKPHGFLPPIATPIPHEARPTLRSPRKPRSRRRCGTSASPSVARGRT